MAAPSVGRRSCAGQREAAALITQSRRWSYGRVKRAAGRRLFFFAVVRQLFQHIMSERSRYALMFPFFLSRENLRWMQEEMQETRAASQRESEKLLKEFQSQAGKISETYSSRLSRAEDTLRESANSIRWKMYIPTIILVLWELVRHLWLRG